MRAIIYKIINYKNKDRLIYLISEIGFISAILKNAQLISSDNFYIQEYMLCELEITNIKDKINNINKINVINDYKNLKDSFDDLKRVMIIFKITSDLIKESRDASMAFKVLEKLLNNYNGEISFYMYLVKFTYFMGIRLDNYLLENNINDKNLLNDLLYLYKLKFEDEIKNDKLDFKKINEFIKNYYSMFLSYKIIGIWGIIWKITKKEWKN